MSKQEIPIKVSIVTISKKYLIQMPFLYEKPLLYTVIGWFYSSLIGGTGFACVIHSGGDYHIAKAKRQDLIRRIVNAFSDRGG